MPQPQALPERRAAFAWTGLILLAAVGCRSGDGPPPYQDGEGFRMSAPSGWVERARSDAGPAGKRAPEWPNVPLPPLGVAGSKSPERMLVRYDRVNTAAHGWLRVSVAELPDTYPLTAWVAARPPSADWHREGTAEQVEVAGLPAARATFTGRWQNEPYSCEVLAARKGDRVYFFTTGFPAGDNVTRDAARQAIGKATWQ
jgi:hypothetical protein